MHIYIIDLVIFSQVSPKIMFPFYIYLDSSRKQIKFPVPRTDIQGVCYMNTKFILDIRPLINILKEYN